MRDVAVYWLQRAEAAEKRVAELEKALKQLSNPTEFSTNSAIYMSRTARNALKGGGK